MGIYCTHTHTHTHTHTLADVNCLNYDCSDLVITKTVFTYFECVYVCVCVREREKDIPLKTFADRFHL